MGFPVVHPHGHLRRLDRECDEMGNELPVGVEGRHIQYDCSRYLLHAPNAAVLTNTHLPKMKLPCHITTDSILGQCSYKYSYRHAH